MYIKIEITFDYYIELYVKWNIPQYRTAKNGIKFEINYVTNKQILCMHIADRKLFQKPSYFIHIEELLSGHPNRSTESQHVPDQFLTKGFMVKYNPHNNTHAKYCIAVGTADYQNKAAPEGLNQTLLRRYHAMKYMKDLKKALAHHVGVIEESMAQYVECQDRIRHIKTLNWR